ncbi:hypothetical protein [Microbacterium sp. SD291]|uniref:hypothetical protein n=1 Tax=Microbacterium sp. SD291 TaxID=2782007 RepID=UPI001A9629A5|nr:hypothetical protein [Microbacterium sp. SD291]MBO0979480.1 hypothetical protein [Microbacterium sp. SD291]
MSAESGIITIMPMSIDEFCASLLSTEHRHALGIRLTDDEARRVHDDPAASRNWYAYWLASAPPAPIAAPALASPPPAYRPHDPQQAAYPGYSPEQAVYPAAYSGMPADAVEPVKQKNVGLWIVLSVLGALILIAVLVVVAAFATARHWTKVDVPEQPETFHSEEYETGRHDVTMDDVNPCHVDQDWTDCTDLMVATYTAACVGVELTEAADAICTEYSGAIDEMKAQDADGYYVASLGTFGSLHQSAETAMRDVSNEDYEPAVTHEAVCYLGFIGECD